MTLKILLKLSCSDILFSFNKNLFRQTDGAAMGCPLGPTLAEFAMHQVEMKMVEKRIKPETYIRYVDDTFALFKTKMLKIVLKIRMLLVMK